MFKRTENGKAHQQFISGIIPDCLILTWTLLKTIYVEIRICLERSPSSSPSNHRGLAGPINEDLGHATASSTSSAAGFGSGCSSSASISMPFGRNRTSRSLGETITFSIRSRTMRCCSAGNSCSQIESSRVMATATCASSREGSSRMARSITPATIVGALSTRRNCSSTAASSSAAGRRGSPEAPACSLFSRTGR